MSDHLRCYLLSCASAKSNACCKLAVLRRCAAMSFPPFLDGRTLHFMIYFHASSSCKLMILLPLQEECACCGAPCHCNRSSSWIKHNDLFLCFHVVCGQLHPFRRHDVLGASMIPVGCLRAMNAMKDHCNTICVLKSAPPLITSKCSLLGFHSNSNASGCSILCSKFPC